MPPRHDRDVDDFADGLQQRTSIGTEVISAVEVGKIVDATVLVVEDLLLHNTQPDFVRKGGWEVVSVVSLMAREPKLKVHSKNVPRGF